MADRSSSTGMWHATSAGASPPRLSPSGAHRGPDLLRSVLDQAGVRAPHTNAPFTAAMLAGLGGAIGFRYSVHVEAGLGPLPTIDAEHGRDPFIQSALHRARVPYSVRQTGSLAVARKNLAGALAERRIVLCVLRRSGLPWHRLDERSDRDEGYEVAVVGLEQDVGLRPDVFAERLARGEAAALAAARCLLDEGLPVRSPLSLTEFMAAWSAHAAGRNQLLTITGATPVALDLSAAVREAVSAAVARLSDPFDGEPASAEPAALADENPPPASGHSEERREWTGVVGMRALADHLADADGPDGWAVRFAPAEHFHRALTRLHDGVQSAYGTQAALRSLYAEFLAEAAPLLGPDQDRYAKAAELLRGAGATWAQVAATALPEDVPALRRYGELAALRRSLMRGQGHRAARRLRGIAREMADLPRAYAAAEPLAGARRRDLLDGLADLVRECAALEDDALRLLHEKAG